MKPDSVYPLKLEPILEAHAWGGSLLGAFLAAGGRPPALEKPTVSWSLRHHGEISSIVANGPWAGMALSRLLQDHAEPLMGLRYRPGDPFPLYARLMAAGETRPIHVYPPASAASPRENNMLWYVVDAHPGSSLGVGLGGGQSRYRFSDSKESLPFESLLKAYPAYPRDSFFIPAGRIHCLHNDVLIWEIGQIPAEPLTLSGAATPGHLAAVSAVNFQDQRIARISGEAATAQATRRVRILPYCPNFFVDEIRLKDRLHNRTDGTVFSLLLHLSGKAEVRTPGLAEPLFPGDAVLLPASLGDYELFAVDGPARLLQVTPNILPR